MGMYPGLYPEFSPAVASTTTNGSLRRVGLAEILHRTRRRSLTAWSVASLVAYLPKRPSPASQAERCRRLPRARPPGGPLHNCPQPTDRPTQSHSPAAGPRADLSVHSAASRTRRATCVPWRAGRPHHYHHHRCTRRGFVARLAREVTPVARSCENGGLLRWRVTGSADDRTWFSE